MTNDVEKRWNDPAAYRAAARYTAVVVIVAGIALATFAFTAPQSVVVASAVPLILLLGGVGAFIKTYRVWRAQGTWVYWQGAGWFLLTLMLVSLSIPGSSYMA
ncbi:MAG: transrane protein [Mycobacterium sp.]|nr:transrane protein [Mycobacterium sp.]